MCRCAREIRDIRKVTPHHCHGKRPRSDAPLSNPPCRGLSLSSRASRRRRHSFPFPTNFGSVSVNPPCRRASTYSVDYIIFFSRCCCFLCWYFVLLEFLLCPMAKSKAKAKVFCFFRTSYLTWLRFHFVFARFFLFLIQCFCCCCLNVSQFKTEQHA